MRQGEKWVFDPSSITQQVAVGDGRTTCTRWLRCFHPSGTLISHRIGRAHNIYDDVYPFYKSVLLLILLVDIGRRRKWQQTWTYERRLYKLCQK